jgi:hypothetical protein
MSSKEKAYSVDHSYNARKFDALFRAINNITFFEKNKNFTKTLWIQANQTEIVINEKMCGDLAIEAKRTKFLNIDKIKGIPYYSLTNFGEFIVNNIVSQPNLVWDAIHVNHLILYRLEESVEFTFSAFYNIAVNFVYNLEVGSKFVAIEVNQEVISKLSDKDVGFSEKSVSTMLQWTMFLEPPLVTPARYVRQPTNYCSIERTYYALSAMYKQYYMSLGTPLLFDEKTINDIKLYLLVPESEIIPQLRLLQQTYPDFVEEQSSHWGTSFVLNKFPDVPFPWLN